MGWPSNRGVGAALASIVATATVLAACGTSSASLNTTTTIGTTKVVGGTVTFAEPPNSSPNYIFPLASGTFFSIANLAQFQELMYRPLYFFGVGSNAQINYQLSLADPPIFTNNNQTVTITLKKYKWSNGEQLSSRDVMFWMNLIKANKANWAAYVPGAFPDNVTSYSAPNGTTIVLNLDKSYNPTWFTYNELSQITPLPIAWDVTSPTSPPPQPSAPNLPDTTTAGATAVYTYLDSLSRNTATFASNPLWKIVDGPWTLKSFSPQGKAIFVPNPRYSGPNKPSIAKFEELPFTKDTTEYRALVLGKQLDYGYIPQADISQKTAVASKGFTLNPWKLFSFNYWVINFNNPTVGPLFQQDYIRQALEHLIDQQRWITKIWKGYATPSYGPIPMAPANSFADSTSLSNPYPYSVTSALELLKAHGWAINTVGTDTCIAPGNGANQCGVGIANGTPLSFTLEYASGSKAISQEMNAFKSATAQAGIVVTLNSSPFDQVIGNAVACTSTQPECKWQMENWAGGCTYAPDYYPTGAQLYGTGAGANYGSYSDPTADSLMQATHTASALQTQNSLNAYQNYMIKSLPVIYQPNPDYELSEIRNTLKGVQQNAFGVLLPEDWYYVK